MASFLRFARQSSVPPAVLAAASFISSSDYRLSSSNTSSSCSFSGHTTTCEAPSETVRSVNQKPVQLSVDLDFDQAKKPSPSKKSEQPRKVVGFNKDLKGYFYHALPMSQVFQPKYDYPMWDTNWDNREPEPSGDAQVDRRKKRYLRKHGVTRHIILIRHGQYDETHKDDGKRVLTELGRQQAHATGERIAEMIRGTEDDASSPCNVKVLRVSNLARAKETADLIASHIPQVERADPDPLLNEGSPAHTMPSGGKPSPSRMERIQEGHERIEAAFRRYFYRADEIEDMPDDDYFRGDHRNEVPTPSSDVSTQHEYEIIICHANVIRYFLCRALQLPPEAWLRLCTFNCSLTYLTIRPTGGVSCRMLGDIGHLPPKLVSFSGHRGFNW